MKVQLTDLKKNILTIEQEISALKKEYDERKAVLDRSLILAKRGYNEALKGLDLDTISLARSILYKRGAYTGAGDQPSVIKDFINWLAIGKSPYYNPKSGYFGTKNYSPWSSQRHDGPYGTGPRHGSVNFALGLIDEARKRDLTDEEKNALIYFLENIEVIEAAEKEAA